MLYLQPMMGMMLSIDVIVIDHKWLYRSTQDISKWYSIINQASFIIKLKNE